jgi:hypothetical protein
MLVSLIDHPNLVGSSRMCHAMHLGPRHEWKGNITMLFSKMPKNRKGMKSNRNQKKMNGQRKKEIE